MSRQCTPSRATLGLYVTMCLNTLHKDFDYGFMAVATLYSRFMETHIGGGVMSVLSSRWMPLLTLTIVGSV